MRAVLVYPVGAGDLDLDILNYPHAERGGRQTVEAEKLAGLVERSGARELFDALFWKGPSKRCPESERRFPASPLRQIFEALAAGDRIDHVAIVLCGSAAERIADGGATDFPTLVLEEALKREDVGSLIEDEFRFTVELLAMYDLNLHEKDAALQLEGRLRRECGIDANERHTHGDRTGQSPAPHLIHPRNDPPPTRERDLKVTRGGRHEASGTDANTSWCAMSVVQRDVGQMTA